MEQFRIEKKISGGLSLVLPSHNGVLPIKTVIMPSSQPFVIVPKTYALGIYLDPVCKELYESGCFKVSPEADFIKAVEAELGIQTSFSCPLTNEEIIKAIKNQNRKLISEWLDKYKEIFARKFSDLFDAELEVLCPPSFRKYLAETFGIAQSDD